MNKIIYGVIFVLIISGAFILLHSKNSSENINLMGDNPSNFKSNPEKSIELLFYDNITKCPLNGEIYIGSQSLGNFSNGTYLLNKTEYNSEFFYNITLSIMGETSPCFGNNKGFKFYRSWEVYDLNYSFENNLSVPFEIELSPRQPVYFEEIQGFIRPEEAMPYLEKMKEYYTFENDTFKDLKKINDYMMFISYHTTLDQYREINYWALPRETLASQQGDCKGWSTSFLSLVKAYNPSLKCYLMGLTTHLSVLCYYEDNGIFIIYDQERINAGGVVSKAFGTAQNEINMQTLLNNYFEEFGLNSDEREIQYLISEKEIILFNKEDHNKDFVNWTINQLD